MMHLKHPSEMVWEDLTNIEDPASACSIVERSFYPNSFCAERVHGIDKLLHNQLLASVAHGLQRDRPALNRLLRMLERGEVFLVQDETRKPHSPALSWQPEGTDPKAGKWIINSEPFIDLFFKSSLRSLLKDPPRPRYSPGIASWRSAPSTREEEEPIAVTRAASPRTRTLPSSATQGLSSELAATVNQCVTHSQTESEALGIAGLILAKQRLQHVTDPRYIDRYHGPDDITRDKDNQLAEWEAKGRKVDSSDVAEDDKGNPQGSKNKNKRRARVMTEDKARKIDLPSNRRGGPYLREEINLWEEIFENEGEKRHLSVHTNTETGRVRVFERNHRGVIIKNTSDFTIENFEDIKQAIAKAFK